MPAFQQRDVARTVRALRHRLGWLLDRLQGTPESADEGLADDPSDEPLARPAALDPDEEAITTDPVGELSVDPIGELTVEKPGNLHVAHPVTRPTDDLVERARAWVAAFGRGGQAQLAREAGVDKSVVSRLLSGKNPPTEKPILAKIEAALAGGEQA